MSTDDTAKTLSNDAVERAVDGDERALEALLRRIVPEIVNSLDIAPKWSRSFDRDDLAQITSIEAILRIGSLRTRTVSGLRAWLERIARNNLHDAIRALESGKRSPVERRVTHAGDGRSARTLLLSLGGDDPSVSAIVGGEEEIARLMDAIAALPPSYEHVVRAIDLDERDVAEVAEEMGRSSGAVHMLCARAHERLRELLDGA